MSQIDAAWGAGPTSSYEDLADRFRPIFSRIREGAVERELSRTLPIEQIDWLRRAGFTALRVPKEQGGLGVSLPELFNLLIELGEADSNVVQAIRGHLGFVESIITTDPGERRERWLHRLAKGDLVGPAWTESGDSKQGAFGTQLLNEHGEWILEGKKFYTTGCLYSDWIDVGVTGPEGEDLSVTVRRDASGVNVVDDWDGFGQTLTASGTTHFDRVRVDENDISRKSFFSYSTGFYQLVHLATLAGIGRALSGEVAKLVSERTRTYSNGNASRVANDAQILQVVGRLRGAAYTSGAIVLKAAEALQRAYKARFEGDEESQVWADAIAELEVSQTLTVVTDLILNATTGQFDALGASATLRPQALDRFWRNARTLTSHNPRIYKDRIVGDFAVNGTLPTYQWRIGVA